MCTRADNILYYCVRPASAHVLCARTPRIELRALPSAAGETFRPLLYFYCRRSFIILFSSRDFAQFTAETVV